MVIMTLFLLGPVSVSARHSVAPAFSYTHIRTTQGDRYYITSPALNYTGDLKIWNYRLYLSVSAILPVWASQNGANCDIPRYYSSTLGTDIFIGISKNIEILDQFGIVPVLGWHQNGIRFQAKSRYLNFYSLTSGLSVSLFMKFKTTQPLLNFMFCSMAIDFIDQLYTENKLKAGYTVTAGIGHTF